MAAVVSTLSCTPGAVTDSSGDSGLPGPGGTGGEPGTVQRASLVVRVSIDPSDASIATTAGISTNGLTVRLQRGASTEPPRTAVTAADGSARFEGLTQGNYEISIDRPLTAAELSLLAPADREASIFAGGASIAVAPPLRDVGIELVAARRGSLVVSEFFVYAAPVSGFYTAAHYVEIYNNSDTTIYLDGIVLFRTSVTATCDELRHLRLDETGVWSGLLDRFPGTGRDYPIRPGEAKVMSVDAIDHRVIAQQLPDLSTAEFELIGDPSDPNNPFAADMERLAGARGSHGGQLGSDHVIGIALPSAGDTTQLEKYTYLAGRRFKIPREAVIDLASITFTPERFALLKSVLPSLERCVPFIANVFELGPALLGDDTNPIAIARKTLGRTSSGAEILQRTRNSSRDLEYAQPLRRSLRRPR